MVLDKVNQEDFYNNVRLPKRGDVICVVPDGWPWGTRDLSEPHWRILKLPGVPVEDLSYLINHETPSDPQNPPKALQYRGYGLNVDKMGDAIASKNGVNIDIASDFASNLMDYQRHTSTFTLPLNADDIKALAIKKTPVSDPAVFGVEVGAVIG